MRNLLFTLFALLTFTLPADELPLPAEKWSLFANSSIEDRVGNDTLPSGFWYGLFPEREPGRGSVVFLRAENRYSSAIYDIALFPPVPGSYRLKGRVRFLGGEECLQIGGTWHLKAEQQPGQKRHSAPQGPQDGQPRIGTWIQRTGEIGEWQTFDIPIEIHPRKACPECGRKYIFQDFGLAFSLWKMTEEPNKRYLEAEVDSLVFYGPGASSTRFLPPGKRPQKKIAPMPVPPRLPERFPENRFDATAYLLRDKPQPPPFFQADGLSGEQLRILNPAFQVRRVIRYAPKKVLDGRRAMRFPLQIEDGQPRHRPLAGGFQAGNFHALLENTKGFDFARFNPDHGTWSILNHIDKLPYFDWTTPLAAESNGEYLWLHSRPPVGFRFSDGRMVQLPGKLSFGVRPGHIYYLQGGKVIDGRSDGSGRETVKIDFEPIPPRDGNVHRIHSSPDSATLYLLADGHTLYEWNPESGKAIQRYYPFPSSGEQQFLATEYGSFAWNGSRHRREMRHLIWYPGNNRQPVRIQGSREAGQELPHLPFAPRNSVYPESNVYHGIRGRYLILTVHGALSLVNLADPAQSLIFHGCGGTGFLPVPGSEALWLSNKDGMFEIVPPGGWGEFPATVESRWTYLDRNYIDQERTVPLREFITQTDASAPDLFRAEWTKEGEIDVLRLSWDEIPFTCEVTLTLRDGQPAGQVKRLFTFPRATQQIPKPFPGQVLTDNRYDRIDQQGNIAVTGVKTVTFRLNKAAPGSITVAAAGQ